MACNWLIEKRSRGMHEDDTSPVGSSADREDNEENTEIQLHSVTVLLSLTVALFELFLAKVTNLKWK